RATKDSKEAQQRLAAAKRGPPAALAKAQAEENAAFGELEAAKFYARRALEKVRNSNVAFSRLEDALEASAQRFQREVDTQLKKTCPAPAVTEQVPVAPVPRAPRTPQIRRVLPPEYYDIPSPGTFPPSSTPFGPLGPTEFPISHLGVGAGARTTFCPD